MARVPEIIRKGAISHVATQAPTAGEGWRALSEIALSGAELLKPAAMEQAQEEGLNSVYRDENGKLAVQKRHKFGGDLADAHNTAAHAKFLSRRQLDISETFTELGNKYQHDPAGFKEAADLYVRSLQSEEGVAPIIREQIVLKAERESLVRFQGLDRQRIQRDQIDANRNTKAQRDMLADDYVNLTMGGDLEAAAETYKEMESLSEFRSNAPWISETEAETQAYLRGVRGTAKAAQLTQRLEGLIGRTDLSDDERKELDDLLSDPDLDPRVRARLEVATQGRLKGIEAAGVARGLSDGSYEGRIIGVESGGKDTAKNPNSTAYGPHQFLKSTWRRLVSEYKPDWANGLSDGELLALRGDRQKSSEMFQHFRRENQAVLTANNIPLNPANEYLAHFFGAGGAVDVLKSDPAELLENVVPSKVIEANPFLKNMTVADVRNWSARKMTMKASDIAAQQTKIDMIEDTELRAMASQALNEQFQVRRRYETASETEYRERLSAEDDTLTEQEILQDHDLSDSSQRSLVEALRKARKDQIEIQQTVADLNNENVNFNPYNTSDRNRVNKAYEATLGGASPMDDQEHIASAVQIAGRTGFAPKSMFDALRAGVASADPAVVSQSAEIANQLLDANPTAFAPYGGRTEIEKALSDYKRFAEFASPEEAGQRVVDMRAEKPKNIADEAKEAVKKLELKDIKDFHDQWFLSDPDLGSALEQNEMMTSYQNLFRDYFMEIGDFEAAKGRALDQLGRIYGTNVVTGSNRVMKFPPQNFYPPVKGNYDWMTKQIEAEVSAHVFGSNAKDPHWLANGLSLGQAGKRIKAGNIKLVSDATTRSEAARKDPTSYVVYYMHKGKLERVPGRYVFDPSEAQSQAQDEFEQGRAFSEWNSQRQQRRKPKPEE